MYIASMFSELLPAIIILFIIAIVGSVIVLQVRKMLHRSPDQSITFSLRDLERLRDDGSLSEDEYEKARQSIIDAARKMTSDISKKEEEISNLGGEIRRL